MMRSAGALLTFLVSVSAVSADLVRQDFGFGMTLETDGQAAVYKIPLPLIVYQHTARPDLGDVRVVNGIGEIVPYALRRAPGEEHTHGSASPLRLFALRGSAVEPSEALKLRLQTGGASVEIDRPAIGGAVAPVTGYLLDARDITDTMSALDVSWDADAPDFSIRVPVEASDDLSHWRRVAEGPVINLHFGGQQFAQQRIELPAVTTKYLRLSWPNQALPPGFTAVSAEPAATSLEIKRLSLTASAVAVEGQPGEYLVDLGAHVPVDRLNLDLPELNTVASADFEARVDPTQPWNSVTRTTLYRLRAGDGSELRNPPVRITVLSARYWRVRVARDGGGIGHGTPALVGGWLPDELIFAARGDAPFELLFGNGAAKPAAVPVSTLTSPASHERSKPTGRHSRCGPLSRIDHRRCRPSQAAADRAQPARLLFMDGAGDRRGAAGLDGVATIARDVGWHEIVLIRRALVQAAFASRGATGKGLRKRRGFALTAGAPVEHSRKNYHRESCWNNAAAQLEQGI